MSDARRLGEHEDGAVEGAEGERSRAVGMVAQRRRALAAARGRGGRLENASER